MLPSAAKHLWDDAMRPALAAQAAREELDFRPLFEDPRYEMVAADALLDALALRLAGSNLFEDRAQARHQTELHATEAARKLVPSASLVVDAEQVDWLVEGVARNRARCAGPMLEAALGNLGSDAGTRETWFRLKLAAELRAMIVPSNTPARR